MVIEPGSPAEMSALLISFSSPITVTWVLDSLAARTAPDTNSPAPRSLPIASRAMRTYFLLKAVKIQLNLWKNRMGHHMITIIPDTVATGVKHFILKVFYSKSSSPRSITVRPL
jgi:hypothetical protein